MSPLLNNNSATRDVKVSNPGQLQNQLPMVETRSSKKATEKKDEGKVEDVEMKVVDEKPAKTAGEIAADNKKAILQGSYPLMQKSSKMLH
jgi:hypothetical protein